MKKKKVHIQSSKRGVIYDRIDPRIFNNINVMYCCEQCSHFDEPNQFCTIGYDASKHLKSVADNYYQLMGRMAVCRFQEVD